MPRVAAAILLAWTVWLAGCQKLQTAATLMTPQATVDTSAHAASPEAPSPQPTYTALPTHTPYPTYTAYPTHTLQDHARGEAGFPTQAPSDSPTPDARAVEEFLGVIRIDVDQQQEREGVVLGISQAVLMPFSVIEQQGVGAPIGFRMGGWDDVQTVIGMRVWVTNTTESIVSIYPEQGQVVVGTEQVDLRNFPFVSDDIGGDVRPGVTQDGVVWFGIRRLPPDQVQEMVYYVNPPIFGMRIASGGEYELVVRMQ